MQDAINSLSEQQISFFEKQCGYVPILMNRSKAVRNYLKGVMFRALLFIFLCMVVKWNEKFLVLLIFYSIYFALDTYRKAFSCLRKQMINNLDKARIVGAGIVVDKAHEYPEGLVGWIRRRSKGERAESEYKYQYYSSLKLSFNGREENWYSCTNMTYEQAVAGDCATVVEFPEEYELGRYCCFLDRLDEDSFI